jgi:hypothetical protein
MAASDEWTVWYLTPRGWESGTGKIDFGGVTPKEPPPDAVKSCRYFEYMSYGASPLRSGIDSVKVIDEQRAKELERQFGPCPEHL